VGEVVTRVHLDESGREIVTVLPSVNEDGNPVPVIVIVFPP
jgi:hypothetical protein